MRLVNRKSRQNTEISMLNLIDVIFMLLIFFMIATTFNSYVQFQLSVPKTSEKLEKKQDTLVEIIIDRNRNYYLKIGEDVKRIELEDLPGEMKKKSAENTGSLTLTADESLEYGVIVEAMAKIKNQNISNINLNIQKSNK